MKRHVLSLLTIVLATGMWAQQPATIDYKQGADQLYHAMKPFIFKLYESQDVSMNGMMQMLEPLADWMETYLEDVKQEDQAVFMNLFMNTELIMPFATVPGEEENSARATINKLRNSCQDKLSDNFYSLAESMNLAARKMEYTTVFDTLNTGIYLKNDMIIVMMLDGIYRTMTDVSYAQARDELRGILSAIDKEDIHIGTTPVSDWKEASNELYKYLAAKMVATYRNNANILHSDNIRYITAWIENHSAGINTGDIDKMSYAQGYYLPLPATVKNANKTVAQMMKRYKKELKKTCSAQCLQTTETMLNGFYSGKYESVFDTLDTAAFTLNDLFWLATVDATLRAMKRI